MGANGFTIHYRDFNFFGRDNDVRKKKKGAQRKKIQSPQTDYQRSKRKISKRVLNIHPKYPINLRGTNDAIVSLGEKKPTPTV